MKLAASTRRDLLLLTVAGASATVIAVITWLLLPPQRVGGPEPRPSTFYNTPDGAKAAYLALNRLGYDVTRLRRPIDYDTLAGIDALILLRPRYCLSEHEASVLHQWLANGHRLLVAPAVGDSIAGPDEPCAGPADWFNTQNEAAEMTPVVTTFDATATADHPLLRDIDQLLAGGAERFDAERPLRLAVGGVPRIVWRDAAGIVAIDFPVGAGRIYALADHYALTNEGLDEADHPVWLANLAHALSVGDSTATIAFDEYHAGFPYRDPSWLAALQLLWSAEWGWAVTQVLLVVLLALFASGKHFGAPEGIRHRPRRTQGEFTRAAGRLLHAARAADVAFSTLYTHYYTRICRRLHVAPDTSPRELLAMLDRQQASDLADAVRAAEAQRGVRPSDSATLRIVSRLHHALENLEHGAAKRK